jgi:hypothetical protein
LINEIDALETWTIQDEDVIFHVERILSNTDYTHRLIKLDFYSLITIFSYLGTNILIKTLHTMGETEPNFLKNFLSELNENDDNEMALYLKERFFLLYRLSVFPALFSDDNFVVLYKTLSK